MNRTAMFRATLWAAFVSLFFMASAHAQATRTWVSGVGDDANPCSRTAPCKTFAGSISKTAAGGEINCLDPGGFGSLTITKALTISCQSGTAGVLVQGTNGITVNAGANDAVFLNGLDFEGLGASPNGISFLGGRSLHVENCLIRGFQTNGINFAPSANAASLVVQDTVVSDNPYGTSGGGGILIAPTNGVMATAVITNVHSDRNLFGLRVQDNGKATVFRSTFASNNANGVLAVATSAAAEINLSDSLVSNNATNGISAVNTGATIRLSHTTISDNATGIILTSGGAVVGTTPGTSNNVGNTTMGAPSSNSTLQ